MEEGMTIGRRGLLTGAAGLGAAAMVGFNGFNAPAEAVNHGGRFVANFISPAVTKAGNVKIFNEMKVDALTFGYRVNKSSKSNFPKAVQDAIGNRVVYEYAGFIQWAAGLTSADKRVVVDGVTHNIVDVGHKSVVVTKLRKLPNDPLRALVSAAKEVGANTYLGLPIPQMREKPFQYLPDVSFMGVMRNFTAKFIKNYNAQGTRGYYLPLEMPMSPKPNWTSVKEVYKMQIEEVAKQRRMTVIISPYFKSRKDGGSGGGTPNTVKEAVQCMKQLLALEKGVNLLIAPQDGLGTGATAFKADRNPNYIATTEDYFRVLKEVAGRKLYVVTECMTPGPTGIKPSVPTTRARVSQQLWTLRNFTQGSIGYKWNNHNGMDKIPGGVMTWRARYGNLN